MADVIYFVIPCLNEEEVLPLTAAKLREKMASLIAGGLAAKGSRILFVDDGSKDGTWRMIEALADTDDIYCGLKLSHNRGHQNALLAGLLEAGRIADAVITMDADLQDDIGAADAFLRAYYDGCDIVYGVRKTRNTDTFFKRSTAEGFYQLMRAMGVRLVFNHADYRLMSRKAIDGLSEYEEVNLFLRGIVPQIGLKSSCVLYERKERAAGESKYPLGKMLAFAWDGITSFTMRPIRLISMTGAACLAVSVVLLVIELALGRTTGIQNFTLFSLWFLSGIITLSLGMTGEYVGKIYAEVKRRPRYFIERRTERQAENFGQIDRSRDSSVARK